ncbi:MAG: hypothetical protein JSS43_19345 [Proteobacteria bacterium]|nr:hypothetical protein [Pseudomonadota bacterium]
MPRNRRGLLAAAALLGTTSIAGTPAWGAFTFSFQQMGPDVVATGAGSLNLAALSPAGQDSLAANGVSAATATAGIAGSVAVYAGITGPASFGPGGATVASSGGGDAVAVNGKDSYLGVPLPYGPGSALANHMTFAGQSFAGLGLTPGTYTWSWGEGATADRFVVQVGPVAAPEPGPLPTFGAGLFCLAALRIAGANLRRRDLLAAQPRR